MNESLIFLGIGIVLGVMMSFPAVCVILRKEPSDKVKEGTYRPSMGVKY